MHHKVYKPYLLMVEASKGLVRARVKAFKDPFAEGRTVVEATTKDAPPQSHKPVMSDLTDFAACQRLGQLVGSRVAKEGIKDVWFSLEPRQRLDDTIKEVVKGMQAAGVLVNTTLRNRLR